MGLGAGFIAVNAAMKALGTEWEDLIETLAVGAKIFIVFGNANDNGTAVVAGEPPSLVHTGNAFTSPGLTTYCYEIPRATSNTSSMLYFIADVAKATGGVPLFWKVTDESGLLSVT